MFSKLQNKIALKKIKDSDVDIDRTLHFSENFELLNQTLNYFEEAKSKENNIIMREEVIEFENQEYVNYLEEEILSEQRFYYNDPFTKELLESLDADNEYHVLLENLDTYKKTRGELSVLLEESNENLKTELKKYAMVSLEEKDKLEAEDLFDKETLDLAKHEHLENLYGVDWLGKQLAEYRKEFNDQYGVDGSNFMITNNLRRLDINDTDEILNKLKDVEETITYMKNNKREILEREYMGE